MLEPRPTGLVPNVIKAAGDVPKVAELSPGDLMGPQTTEAGGLSKGIASQANLENAAMLMGAGEVLKAVKYAPKIGTAAKALLGSYFATQGAQQGAKAAGERAGNPNMTPGEKGQNDADIALNAAMVAAPVGEAIHENLPVKPSTTGELNANPQSKAMAVSGDQPPVNPQAVAEGSATQVQKPAEEKEVTPNEPGYTVQPDPTIKGKFNIVTPSGRIEEEFPTEKGGEATANETLKSYNTPGIPSEVDDIARKSAEKSNPQASLQKGDLSPDDLEPVVDFNGKIYSGGDTHGDVIMNNLPPTALLDTPDLMTKDTYRKFRNKKTGEIIGRREAADAIGLKYDLDSETLNVLKKQAASNVHGGAESELPADQQSISKANNSREAFDRVQAESDAKKKPAEIPLGLNRPSIQNPALKSLSDEDFDKEFQSAKKSVDSAEKGLDAAFDAGRELNTQQKQAIASAQDRWTAADLERFRRNTKNTVPEDLFYKLKNLAGNAVKFGDKSDDHQKAIIILDELKRQGATPEEMLAGIKLSSPDAAEVFKADLQDIKKISQSPSTPEDTKNVAQSPSKTVAPQSPELVGLGAATPKELPGGGDASVTGLAARVRSQREDAGMTDPTQPGKGIAPEASVERGRQLVQSGASPESVMQQFEKTNRVSSDDFAIARAHTENLARATNAAEEKFGTDSPEYRAAYKTESDWAARTKAMQTEWAKSGHAQQGQVDIDTGTFSGLKRAYRDAHDGAELPKKDEVKAKELAAQNQKLEAEKASLMKRLSDAIEKASGEKVEPRVRLIADKLKGFFDTRAKSALERIQARRAAGRLFTGIDPTELADYADYGASKILAKGIEGAEMTAEWAKEMTDEIGDFVKPHLKQIYDASRKALNEQLRKVAGAGDTAQKVRKAARSSMAQKIPTVENVRQTLADYKGGKMSPEHVKALWNYTKKNYIDKGNSDFSDIVNKVSTDLGLKFKDVANGLSQPKSVRKITDELWRKQTDARRVSESAKRWVQQKNQSALGQIVPRAARLMFGAKVFGHGAVAFGTHAPMVAFVPKYWNNYLRDFGKMYKMVFSQAEYEKNVQALKADPNYNLAGRAGLVNDPYKVEDFNNPDMAQYFGRLSGAGNRGYFALKVLRQDMFNQTWDKLPETIKTPEMAKAMADDINHITGVVKSSGGKNASLALFAPRLLMSRAAFLAGDPYKAIEITTTAMSPKKWASLPPEQKFQVINQVKQKATILATAYGLLLANQALLSSTGSKQKINLTDPTKSDFFKFKGAGMDFSYGNAVMNMARLPLRLWTIGAGDGGKLKHVIYPDESMYSAAGEFARSQASPLASLGLDLIFKGDYQNRPLPQIPGYGKPIPVPKRLAAQGIKPYTWPEFVAEQVSPIPLEEAEREIWRTGLGLNDQQVKSLIKAAGTTIVMAGTGGRLTEDVQPSANPPKKR